MAGEVIQVQGLDELVSNLKKLDSELLPQLKKVGKDAAELVAQTGRQIAPVLTGRLRNSIKPGSTAKGARVSAGSGALPYAGVIHFGWHRHHIAPNPFLYHALDQRRDEVIDQYEKGINDLIDKIVGND